MICGDCQTPGHRPFDGHFCKRGVLAPPRIQRAKIERKMKVLDPKVAWNDALEAEDKHALKCKSCKAIQKGRLINQKEHPAQLCPIGISLWKASLREAHKILEIC